MKKVITYGTFDTLHFGHLRLLERARKLGDYLIVGLSTDEFNAEKGKKAHHTYGERLNHLLACRYVDEVVPEESWNQKIRDVQDYGVDCFAIGDDWEGKFDFLRAHCSVVYLSRTPSISSTLIRKGVAVLQEDELSLPLGSASDSLRTIDPPCEPTTVALQRVLVFPCGSESGLEIHAALKYEKGIELVGASSADDHGSFVFKNYIGGLPYIQEPNFIDEFNRVLKENAIDWVFPAYDDVLLFLSDLRDQVDVPILTSSREVVQAARSKRKTYEALSGLPFVPRLYESPDDIPQYPVFLKPDVGQGSQGVYLAQDRATLDGCLRIDDSLLICEYLPGDEFTVDCFSNSHGEVLFCGARKRARVKSGISVGTFPVDIYDEVKPICDSIMARMRFRGAWFFQVKRARDGSLKLLEVASRIAGSMGGFRNWGVNFPALTVYDFAGYDVKILRNPHSFVMDRSLVSRYKLSIEYARVYIDFDDTITHGPSTVNPFVMFFLYQCKSKGKSIVLVTRHNGDVGATLNSLGIAAGLFEHVVHLRSNEAKSSVMRRGEPAIFIDDSFRERQNVLEAVGLPVFAVDAIESLIDWRR